MGLYSESSIPLYQQLYHSLVQKIKQGEWKQGERIPSESQLCELYHVSRVTVRAAVEKLVEEGMLIKRHGKGTYVSIPVFVETMAGGSFTKSCLQNGVVPRTDVRFIRTVAATETVARGLSVTVGEPVHQVCRIRYTDDVAAIYEVDYFRGQDDFVLEADVIHMPMSEIISQKAGLFAQEFTDQFQVFPADEALSQVFGCSIGTPLLLVQQMVMAEDRQILYYNEQYILSDRYRYVVSYH